MNLESLRKKSDLKAKYIAAKLGISRQQYRNYETGLYKPNACKISKLAQLFQTEYEEIQKALEDKKC